jgi:hypothetical protein
MNPVRRFLLVLALPAAACSRADVVEFGPPRQLPQQQRPTQWGASTGERLGLPDAAEKVWVADLPRDFEVRPPARFRDAVWAIAGEPEADVYLTEGVGGGVAGNLARWYTQQFGIAEVPAVEALPVVEFAGRPGRLAELQGTFQGKPDQAALIAFFADGDRVTSLRFNGPGAVIARHRDSFLQLARTLRKASQSPNPKAPPIQPGQSMPPTHPPVPDVATGTSSGSGPFTGTAAAGWSPKPGSNRWLHHAFGSDGEVYVSQLGGTLKPMLDVWRGEVAQGPLTDAEFAALPRIAFLGEDAVLLDVTGDFRSMGGKQIPGARMLVAARADAGAIVFAKLVGPAADVAAEVESFVRFCGSVRRAP